MNNLLEVIISTKFAPLSKPTDIARPLSQIRLAGHSCLAGAGVVSTLESMVVVRGYYKDRFVPAALLALETNQQHDEGLADIQALTLCSRDDALKAVGRFGLDACLGQARSYGRLPQ